MLSEYNAAALNPAISTSAHQAGRHLWPHVSDVTRLSGADRTRMFDIYAKHYDGTGRARFEADLDAKDLVLTVHTDDGTIQGFTTLLVLDDEIDGLPLRAIYSGDTIIDRAYWGSQVLAFHWIRLAGAIKSEAPELPLYWFLIVKGHRTYRYLSAFSKCFYPHWQVPTPAALQAIMDQLASRRFPDFYRPELGIVHFPETHGHLKPALAQITAAEAARADVSYFLTRNPGYRTGDELVCLTELAPANLTSVACKQFLLGFQQ